MTERLRDLETFSLWMENHGPWVYDYRRKTYVITVNTLETFLGRGPTAKSMAAELFADVAGDSIQAAPELAHSVPAIRHIFCEMAKLALQRSRGHLGTPGNP
jgi:hypothetical protein